MTDFTVIKRDYLGQVRFEYSGQLLRRDTTSVCVRALFTIDEVDLGVVIFRVGDVFTEWHYSDRWYNIFRVQARDTGLLKGWYCNITRPAEIDDHRVMADDLALDVFVTPSEDVLVLDEDEFAALPLPQHERASVWAAVEAIKRLVATHTGPFEELDQGVSRR